ncbi:MAG: hypothetical protein M3336_02115 [Chloroflexota bacterium]|nr:hypothetical protein [Chloroflexota bacterium]
MLAVEAAFAGDFDGRAQHLGDELAELAVIGRGPVLRLVLDLEQSALPSELIAEPACELRLPALACRVAEIAQMCPAHRLKRYAIQV